MRLMIRWKLQARLGWIESLQEHTKHCPFRLTLYRDPFQSIHQIPIFYFYTRHWACLPNRLSLHLHFMCKHHHCLMESMLFFFFCAT